MFPRARHDELLIEDLEGELVIYDRQQDEAHMLNPAAALLWRHCDGNTDTETMAKVLAEKLNLPSDENVVWKGLEELEKAHLLAEPLTRPTNEGGVSRRTLLRRAAVGAGIVVALPTVYSILVPEPVMAGSAGGCGDPCKVFNSVEPCGFGTGQMSQCCIQTGPSSDFPPGTSKCTLQQVGDTCNCVPTA